MKVHGKSILAENDTSSCGAKFNKLSSRAVMNNSNGIKTSSLTHNNSLLTNSLLTDNDLYDEQIQLKTIDGTPYSETEYWITFEDGSIKHGITDIQGNTQRFETEKPLSIISIDLIVDTCCNNEACTCEEH